VTQRLIACVQAMVGPAVAVAAQDPAAPTGTLWPAEAAAMVRARPARLAEFTSGRVAARAAMAALGLPPAAVPMGPDRAPLWPAGLVGSISHGGGACLAILARSNEVTALGLDIELDDPLPADIIDEVLTPTERAGIAHLSALVQGQHARLVFAAKEAAYKAIYPRDRTVLGFAAMTVRVAGPDSFAATLSGGEIIAGRYARHAGLLVASVVRHPRS